MTSSDLWDAETAARYDESSAVSCTPEVLDPGGVVPRRAGRGRACPASARSSTWSGTASGTCAPRRSRSRASATRRGTWRPAAGSSSSCGCPASVGSRRAGRGALPRRMRARSTTSVSTPHDLATQQGTSHHYTRSPTSIRYGSSNFRYIWPAECDLMAQLAGLELERRSSDWVGQRVHWSRRQRKARLGAARESLSGLETVFLALRSAWLSGAWELPCGRPRWLVSLGGVAAPESDAVDRRGRSLSRRRLALPASAMGGRNRCHHPTRPTAAANSAAAQD